MARWWTFISLLGITILVSYWLLSLSLDRVDTIRYRLDSLRLPRCVLPHSDISGWKRFENRGRSYALPSAFSLSTSERPTHGGEIWVDGTRSFKVVALHKFYDLESSPELRCSLNGDAVALSSSTEKGQFCIGALFYGPRNIEGILLEIGGCGNAADSRMLSGVVGSFKRKRM